jgi:hypothetical protein
MKDTNINLGNMYDMNKQIMDQVGSPINPIELYPYQKKIEDWFNWKIDSYAMLLCHERRDYTVFHLYEKQNPNPPALAAQEFIGCLLDRGDVLSIEETEDKQAWEIWLRIDGQSFCYYLFPYDNAVIEV